MPGVCAHANPFRAQRMDALAFRDPTVDLPGILQRFARQEWRGVLVGPHGSGKTTLREGIEHQLSSQGWQVATIMAQEDRPFPWQPLCAALRLAGPRTLLSIDGLDQLGWWRWRYLARRLAGVGAVLATSHQSGRLPLLHQHRSDPVLLAELMAELLGQPLAQDMRVRSQALWQEHRGDIRACLRACYDNWADSAEHPNRL